MEDPNLSQHSSELDTDTDEQSSKCVPYQVDITQNTPDPLAESIIKQVKIEENLSFDEDGEKNDQLDFGNLANAVNVPLSEFSLKDNEGVDFTSSSLDSVLLKEKKTNCGIYARAPQNQCYSTTPNIDSNIKDIEPSNSNSDIEIKPVVRDIPNYSQLLKSEDSEEFVESQEVVTIKTEVSEDLNSVQGPMRRIVMHDKDKSAIAMKCNSSLIPKDQLRLIVQRAFELPTVEKGETSASTQKISRAKKGKKRKVAITDNPKRDGSETTNYTPTVEAETTTVIGSVFEGILKEPDTQTLLPKKSRTRKVAKQVGKEEQKNAKDVASVFDDLLKEPQPKAVLPKKSRTRNVVKQVGKEEQNDPKEQKKAKRKEFEITTEREYCIKAATEREQINELRRKRRAEKREKVKDLHDKAPIKCFLCGQDGFPTREDLLKHARIHRPHHCDQCEETFVHEVRLKMHKKSAHGTVDPKPESEQPLCAWCGKKFARKAEYKAHVTIHTGEKPYKCHCGKSFRTRYDYTVHERRHNNKRPYPCHCGRNFVTCSELKAHARRSHKDESLSDVTHSDQQIVCNICSFTTNSDRSLKQHMYMHNNKNLVSEHDYASNTNENSNTSTMYNYASDKEIDKVAQVTDTASDNIFQVISGTELVTDMECEEEENDDEEECFTVDPNLALNNTTKNSLFEKVPQIENNREPKQELVLGASVKKTLLLEPERVDESPFLNRCEKTFSISDSLPQHNRNLDNINKTKLCSDNVVSPANVSTNEPLTNADVLRYRCDSCDESFAKKRQLRRHKKSLHSKNDPCPAPEIVSKSTQRELNPNTMQRSQQSIMNTNTVPCPETLLVQNTDAKLPNTVEHVKKYMSCEQTDLTSQERIPKPSDLHKTLKSDVNIPKTSDVHKPKPSLANQPKSSDASKSSLKCFICGETGFLTRDELLEHANIHNPYSCHLCSESFKNELSLKQHRKNEHGEQHPGFLCSWCGKHFRKNQMLKHHVRTHTGEKPFLCPCGKAFRTASDFQIHKRRHLNDRRYECPCGKKFVTASDMNKHSTTKQCKDKAIFTHFCEVCSFQCTNVSSLSIHMNIHKQREDVIRTSDHAYAGEDNLDTTSDLLLSPYKSLLNDDDT